MRSHDPAYYHANRRVSCSSGCIYGRPYCPPSKKAKIGGASPHRPKRTRENYQAGAKKSWETRRARMGQ